MTTQQFPEDFYHDPFGIDRYVVQEKVLLEWKAPSRITRQPSRKELLQAGLLVLLLIALLITINEFFLSIAIGALAVLFFMYLTTQPSLLNCSVTTIGVKIEDKYYYWPQLSQFWFEEKDAQHVLLLRNTFPTIHYLKLVIQPAQEEEIKTLIGKYLLYKKPTETAFQKLWKKWANKIPLAGEFIW